MSFLQREYDALHVMCCNTPLDDPYYPQIYAAKQALAWAMEPDGFASPSKMLNRYRGLEGGTEGTGVTYENGLPTPSSGVATAEVPVSGPGH